MMCDSSIVTISKDLTTKYSPLNKFCSMTWCKYKLEVELVFVSREYTAEKIYTSIVASISNIDFRDTARLNTLYFAIRQA